jgi:hypothetical protein
MGLVWPMSVAASDTVIPLKGPAAGKVTAKIVVREDPEQGRVMACEVKIRRGFRAKGDLLLKRTFADPDLDPQGKRLFFVEAQGRRIIDQRESTFYAAVSGDVTCRVRVTVAKNGKTAKARGNGVVALFPPAPVPE